MGEVAQEEGLLAQFYPEEVLHFWQREEDITRLILEGMKIGDLRYTQSERFNYKNLKPEPVTLEEMIADVGKANLVVFGKNVELFGRTDQEKEIVSKLVQKFADREDGKELTIATTTGHFDTMGKLEGMKWQEVLEDYRFKTEVDEYLAGISEAVAPVSSGRVFFPDNKLVISKKDQKNCLDEFFLWGHVLPIERAREIGDNLYKFFETHGEKEALYLFGSELWALSSFTAHNIHPAAMKSRHSRSVRVISQNALHVKLSQSSVPQGVYKITLGNNLIEYVVISQPIGPTHEITQADEIKLLADALEDRKTPEQVAEMKLSPGAQALYTKILRVQSERKAAKTMSTESKALPETIKEYVKKQATIFQEASAWYNSLVATGNIDKVLAIAQQQLVAWEHTQYCAEKHKLYLAACNAIKDLEPLVKKYSEQLGIKESYDKSLQVKEEYERAKEAHEKDTALIQKIKSRGIQTVPIYINADGKEIMVITPFASSSDKVSKALDKEIVEFLSKTANETIGPAIGRTNSSLHEIAAVHRDLGSILDYARAINSRQKEQPWFKLGYHLDILLGPTPAQTMGLDTELPEEAEVNYETFRAKLQSTIPGIKVPTKDEIRPYYSGRVLKDGGATNFACIVVELAGGEEIALGPLSTKIVEHHGLNKGAIYQFIRKNIADQVFPKVFELRQDGETTYVRLKQEYLQTLKANA